jgi:hypothetical protein
MNAQQMAEQLTGRTYPLRITKEEAAQAKAAGLVIVYGASDDLMEFEGAINEELGAYDGTTARVSPLGLLKAWEDVEGDEETFEAYFKQKAAGFKEIEAVWSHEDMPDTSWRYKTDIPHAVFDVMEDGDIYCRGIVFALADCGSAQ